MRILLISDFYPPYRGGMEQHVKSLAHYLALRGHLVSVATTAAAPPEAEPEKSAVAVYPVPGLPTMLPFLNRDRNRPYPLPMLDPLACRALQRLIERVQPDVVHAHGWSAFTALHLGLPLVTTLHDSGLFCPKRTLLRGDGLCREGPGLRCIGCGREQYGLVKSAATLAATQLGRYSLPKARAYIAVSAFVRDVYLRFTNLRPDQVEVIPNFYRGDDDAPGQQATDLPLPARFILFLGYLARYKGVHVLLEAYRRLRTDVPLVLIGYPMEKLRVSDPRILIVEGASHAGAMQALARCLFAVVPSIVPDSMPTVALEAMSQGKAVVASSSGGLPDIVLSGKTGLLAPPGDAEALATKMAELLDDPGLSQRLGEAGQRRLREEFSAHVVVPRIEAVYRRVVGC
jgi:glycosyltransferase involved in cell wall biosynthesis